MPATPLAAPAFDRRISAHITLGLPQAGPADVIRGGEMRIAGLLALSPGFDGGVRLPGRHGSWVGVSADEVVSPRRLMTGKMVTARSEGSVLRQSLGARAGMATPSPLPCPTRSHGPSSWPHGSSRSGRRASWIGCRRRARRARLLIGAELSGARPWWLGRRGRLTGPATGRGVLVSALALRSTAPAAAPRRCQCAPSALPRPSVMPDTNCLHEHHVPNMIRDLSKTAGQEAPDHVQGAQGTDGAVKGKVRWYEPCAARDGHPWVDSNASNHWVLS